MDISGTIAAKSDQLNAEDLISGPRVVTVEKVTKGSAEQPVNIHLTEFPGRPFRPCLTMRRVLVAAWGKDASEYTGRKMLLYNDPAVRFGGQETGGIRISALSHIDTRLTLALTVTRGRRAPFTVDPLPDAPTLPPITDDDAVDFARAISEAKSVDELNKVGAELKARDLGSHRSSLQAAWTGRNNELKGTAG